MIWIDNIFRLAYMGVIIYAARMIYRREKVIRGPVKYMVTYLRCTGGQISYGSVGTQVSGGITGDSKLEEVTAYIRKATGIQDAFVMGFSKYEPEAQ